jgi:hypothetical protein
VGITSDKPLFAVLFTTYEASEADHATVTDRARGLTPEGEVALIKRMSCETADATDAKADRLVRGFDLCTALLAKGFGMVLPSGGHWWRHRQSGITSAHIRSSFLVVWKDCAMRRSDPLLY